MERPPRATLTGPLLAVAAQRLNGPDCSALCQDRVGRGCLAGYVLRLSRDLWLQGCHPAGGAPGERTLASV